MKVFLAIALLLWACATSAFTYNAAYDADVDLIFNGLKNDSGKLIDETLVRLRWAGISDPRIFDQIADRLSKGAKISNKFQDIYVKALVFSGNPKYLDFLESLLADKTKQSRATKTVKKYLPWFEKYRRISDSVNVAAEKENVQTNEQLWALRYRLGLQVVDRERLRWAARDMFLFASFQEALTVGGDYLVENVSKPADSYKEDAMTFIVKALAKNLENDRNRNVLKEVANTAISKKVYKHAVAHLKKVDYSFTPNNPRFE